MYVLAAIPIQRTLAAKIAPLQCHKAFTKSLQPSRMELHVTLKAPQDISDDLKNKWMEAAQMAYANFSSVELKITGLDFITTTVLALYIDPKPLVPLHNALTSALQPYNSPADGLHEGERYQPHITIGRALRGPLDTAQRRLVLEKLTLLAPMGGFRVGIVRLYGRDEQAYRPLLDVALTD